MMNKKRLAAFVSVLLCVCLLFTSCGNSDITAQDIFFPWMRLFEDPEITWDGEVDNAGRKTIPYSQMEYERPDVDGIKAQITSLIQSAKNANSFEELWQYDKELEAISKDFSTMSTLAELKKYQNVYDSYYDEEYRYCSEQAITLWNLVNEFNTVIVEGPYADQYREAVGDYVYASMQNDLILNSEEVENYKKERKQLNADYNQRLSTLTVSYNGQEYTLEEIPNVGNSIEEVTQLYTEYFSQNAPWFAETYRRMVELDKLTAEALGFESAADMYYLSYARDYTPEDALAYCANAKQVLAPLVPYLENYPTTEVQMDLNTTIMRMPSLLREMDPELVEAWGSMIQYELYDYAASPEKQSGIAFTTTLPSYDAAFCYGYWDDTLNAATTMIHEFGHYYNDWLQWDNTVVFNLDILEIHSQALELLALEHFDKLTMYKEEAQRTQLQRFIQPLTYQALLEEFQIRVYELDTFDADTLGLLFADLLEEYGYSGYMVLDENGADNTWFQVTHLFDAPFYTISYATSACEALQIWEQGQVDWNAAVDTYMELLHADQNQPFLELMDEIGLRSPFEAATLQDLAALYTNMFSQPAAAAA